MARSYLRLNFEQAPGEGDADMGGMADITLLDVWLEDSSGERIINVEKGAELRFGAEASKRTATSTVPASASPSTTPTGSR